MVSGSVMTERMELPVAAETLKHVDVDQADRLIAISESFRRRSSATPRPDPPAAWPARRAWATHIQACTARGSAHERSFVAALTRALKARKLEGASARARAGPAATGARIHLERSGA